MKNLILVFFFLFVSFSVYAQNPSTQIDSIGITKSIHALFEGMFKGDSALVHSVFSDEVVMHTVFKNKKGETVLKKGSLQDFLDAVGTAHTPAWDEQISDLKIQQDGALAHVWTPYCFYLGEKKLHCGVNSFHLVQIEGLWKIVHLIDTRR